MATYTFISDSKIALSEGNYSQGNISLSGDTTSNYKWQHNSSDPPSQVVINSLTGIDFTTAYNGATLNAWTLLLTLANGTELYMMKGYSAGDYSFSLGYKLSGQSGVSEITSYGLGGYPIENTVSKAFIMLGTMDRTSPSYQGKDVVVYLRGASTWSIVFTGAYLSNAILESVFYQQPTPPEYSWVAWDQIAGNNGRYRCNLTMVNDGTVSDIGTSIQRGREYFSRITTASSIYSIIQNAELGAERVIAYSGAARLTLTVNAGTQNVSRQLVYKFYLDQISETEPFYTATQIIYLTGNSPTADVLLSFVYDPNETVAAFLPIEKVYYQAGLEQFIFGGISPTADEMLYMLYWLNESQRGDYPYDTGTDDNGGEPAGPQPGDHIGTPSVPTLGGMNTGMFTVYCPDGTQLAQIAQFLWSDNVLDNIKKYFNNFADNIIALYVLPCKPTTLPFKNFKVGNMESDTITNVEYLTKRFAQIDMGSVYIKNTFDSYLDYSPFTKFEIYLPGIGMQTLSADDIMCPTDPDTGELIENTEGSVISLTYNVDLMTGILVAMVSINGELRYQFPGKIGYTIPLTGENYANIARGFVTAASGLIGAVATGGLSAPLTAGGVSAAVSGTVNAMKPEIHRGGNLSGDASMLGEKSPYLVYHRPNKPLLKNQERYTGFPSYKSGALSEFSGLTQVIDTHIEGISCTEAERAEILNLLKGGVIL